MENKNEHTDANELIQKVKSFIEENELKKDSFEKLISECFNELKDNSLLKSFEENKFNTKLYPQLKFTIGCDKEGNLIKSEIESLEHISEENFKKLTDHVEKSNDVYLKLLYSIVWKQGDLTKLDGIIKGITDKPNYSKTGAVFNAFGKHLRDRANPIIDQHVIRAFLIIESKEINEQWLLDIRKREDFNKNKFKIDEIDVFQRYTKWLNDSFKKDKHKNKEDFFYYADHILFSLGKTIKL